MAVREPKLKIEQKASSSRVLKGQQVKFEVSVTNTGDGPARDVIIEAKLGPGLRHKEGTTIQLALADLDPPQKSLKPGDTFSGDFIVDAVAAGEQQSEVSATSPDVVPGAPEAQTKKVVKVVEPRLVLQVKGPT